MPESKTRKKKGARPQQPYRATPSAKKKPPSPTWYVVTMFGLMGIGVLAVVARYVFQLDYLVLIGGLVALAAGFLMTTNYR
jgi:Cell division protein CrgA